MQPQAQHAGLQGGQQMAGTWATRATHPALPGIVVTGQTTFEWLPDQRFLIWRSHYDHPQLPDAIAVTGIIDGKPSMYYFDPRGVHRVFEQDKPQLSDCDDHHAGARRLTIRERPQPWVCRGWHYWGRAMQIGRPW
jgi:hypothetical protein